MFNLKAWISAARLRTLPLSVSGILVGTAFAYYNSYFNLAIFILAVATTLALQILSNFANDYGDGVKGTDNEDRVGPMRALQSGSITDKQMKTAIIINSIIAMILAISLIYVSFGKENLIYSLAFILLGLLAIYAAIKYTVGNSAYGYRGFGDVFVFIFFGLVSVIGTYFLFSLKMNSLIILPAIAVGLLSTAVLNLNNLRDYLSDRKAGKNTMVVKLGIQRAKKYHISIIVISIVCFATYFFMLNQPLQLLSMLGFIPLFFHIKTVVTNANTVSLDPELKKVALSTFGIALLHLIISLSFN